MLRTLARGSPRGLRCRGRRGAARGGPQPAACPPAAQSRQRRTRPPPGSPWSRTQTGPPRRHPHRTESTSRRRRRPSRRPRARGSRSPPRGPATSTGSSLRRIVGSGGPCHRDGVSRARLEAGGWLLTLKQPAFELRAVELVQRRPVAAAATNHVGRRRPHAQKELRPRRRRATNRSGR